MASDVPLSSVEQLLGADTAPHVPGQRVVKDLEIESLPIAGDARPDHRALVHRVVTLGAIVEQPQRRALERTGQLERVARIVGGQGFAIRPGDARSQRERHRHLRHRDHLTATFERHLLALRVEHGHTRDQVHRQPVHVHDFGALCHWDGAHGRFSIRQARQFLQEHRLELVRAGVNRAVIDRLQHLARRTRWISVDEQRVGLLGLANRQFLGRHRRRRAGGGRRGRGGR